MSEPRASGDGVGRGRGKKVAKQALKEVQQCMQDMGIGKMNALMAEKQESGSVAVNHVPCVTNVYGVHLPAKSAFRYDVSVTAFNKQNRAIELNKVSRNDYLVTERKQRCVNVFNYCNQDEFFKQPGQVLFYDGQKIMFALVKLAINGDKCKIFKIDASSIKLDLKDIDRVEFALAEVSESFEITLNDMSRFTRDLTFNDRTMLQFTDIATSQSVIFDSSRHIAFGGGTSYLKNPFEEGFNKRSCPELPEGKFVSVGLHKSACAVEGPGGRGACNIALLVDTAKTAFHQDQNCMDKALAIIPNLLRGKITPVQINQLRKQMKGLYAETRLKDAKTVFLITNITGQSARSMSFEYCEKKVTVEEYYKTRYGVTLECPNAPLLVSSKGQRNNYFPMEITYVKPFQRVQQGQQTSVQLRGMREACIIPPIQRMQENQLNIDAVGLMDNRNPWFSESGMAVKNSLSVDARLLPPPNIDYGNMSCNINPLQFDWSLKRDAKFILPAKVEVWAICAIGGSGAKLQDRDLREFAQLYVKTCQARGVQINAPADIGYIGGSANEIETYVKNAAIAGCSFILFVQDDVCTLHDFIKEMERKYVTVTQDMKMSRALDIMYKRKTQTLDNIVCKSNIKLGGLCHDISASSPQTAVWFKKGRLFIGFAMSHSGPQTEAEAAQVKSSAPSVSAYAANITTDSNFHGDFGFHDPRRTDNVSFCSSFTSKIIEKYRLQRGCCPTQVIIYRAGIGEGEFGMAHQFEIPLIRQALKESKCGAIPLTFIVANRMHRLRVFPKNIRPGARASDQNLLPGCVIDSLLVHPKFNEFYLNSHKALQGSSKATRYTVLIDDNKFTMDELEGMTYSLCFCHQIVTLTTSTPTPLYVASLYADRGRRLMNQYFGSEEGSSSDGGPRADSRSTISIEKANAEIPFEGTKLADVRVNA